MTPEQKAAIQQIAGRVLAWGDYLHYRGYVPGDTEPIEPLSARVGKELRDLAHHLKQVANG